MVREVEQERARLVLIDEPNRVIGDQFGEVALLRLQFVVDPPVGATGGVDVRDVVDVAAHEAAEAAEAVSDRVEPG